MKGQVNAINMN